MFKVKHLLILILVILVAFATVVPVFAAPLPPEKYHVVKPGDTLGKIAAIYKVAPWDIFRANPAMMAKPNYPIFLNTRLSIPAPGGTKSFPSWVLNQPPATMYPRLSGKDKLILTVNNFPLNSNWYVKADGVKIGKIKVLKKAAWTVTLTVPKGTKNICLKNQMTDFSYCRPVIQPLK